MRALRVVSLSLFGGGMLAAMLLMRAQATPVVLPTLAPATYLLLSRTTALVAYALLWLSMALGVSISNKLSRIWPGGPAAADLHRYASLLGLVFAVAHVLVLLGAALGYSIDKALLPFAGSSYRPFWVGLLGKLSLYLMALVGLSFFVRARLGHRAWRRIHYLSFAVFLLALIHGLFAGTDTPAPWALGMYAASGAVLLGLTIYRLSALARARQAPATQPSRRTTPTPAEPERAGD
jgi:predicted ferric reductase